MPTDSSTAMVSFHDGPLRYFTAESVESLAGSLRSASTVSETLFRTERALATSKAYIARQVRPGHRHRPAPHPHEWASGGGISRFSRGFGPSNSASTRLSRGRHAAGASSLPAFDNEGLGSPSSSASSLATAAAAAMEAQLGVETDPAELAHTATGGYEYIQDENMDDGDMEMAEYSDEGSYPESS
ncbi:MAG: hypothetical protein BJ554DRAFT_5450 [Olpidium bornovanus]|uniref:Uncharacterized protein n=1 Tax=Olpidium bornovanus TaxID=278681 RepID=A0A8H8DKV6_9FUNG|nr:MAG: hypothetical protein BJ554DRAFT_5450 [Olpidium bornovanus]